MRSDPLIALRQARQTAVPRRSLSAELRLTKWYFLGSVTVVLFAGAQLFVKSNRTVTPTPVGALALDTEPDDDVLKILRRRCAVCHGGDLERPEGRFGYVLDLARLAGNPEIVIPGEPQHSELWLLIEHDEMPPRDSPDGVLTEGEKLVIKNWISGGCQIGSLNK